MKGRVKAIVQVMLEVEADSVWDTDTTWDQIAKQAEDDVGGMFLVSRDTSNDLPRRVKSIQVVEVRVRPEGK